jgi:hypothetical protein
MQSITRPSAGERIADRSDADKAVAAAEAFVVAAECGNTAALFEPEAIASLCELKAQDVRAWTRLRQRLKKSSVNVIDLDKRMRAVSGKLPSTGDGCIADRLIELARSQCQLMHDAQQECYAVFEFAGARQVYAVCSRGFREFLSHRYYQENDRAPPESALQMALTTLRGQAKFDGELCEVFMRTAKTNNGYWLDLCNEAWQCVLITPQGWSVRGGDGCPLFSRSTSMRPLPIPVRGDTMAALWPLVNIVEEDRPLILAWLLECLRPDTPNLVLELTGEQGSIKSTTQRFLRRLVDPNQADLRSAPKSVDDVWIAARNSHMVSLENLSVLAPAYQDALCVFATGGAHATRTLYTNTEETIIELCKPVVLNGISVVVTAQDLLDRCLHLDLPVVTERHFACDIEARFHEAWPSLLGALLDLFVQALRELPHVHIDPERRPRMADFALLGEALVRAQGRSGGHFLSRYNEKRRQDVFRTIDASPVGAALMAHFDSANKRWRGPLSELLTMMEPYKQHVDEWPKTPKALGDALRRISPALRQIGFTCNAGSKTGGVILWEIVSPAVKS